MKTSEKRPVAAALGVFDGVHLGHRAVIAQAAASGVCHAVTFQAATMPEKQGHPLRYIYRDGQRDRLLKDCGAAAVTALPFGQVRGLDGERFCREILLERIGAERVVCGADFRFGSGASCGTEQLIAYGQQLGFAVELVPQVQDSDGLPVSSGRIRALLQEGAVSDANRLLGADYQILTPVVTGRQQGRLLGAPTANQLFEPWQCVPMYGVYASFAEVEGVRIPSVTSIGVQPTLTDGTGRPVAETHLIGWQGTLNGVLLPVTLTAFLRGEQRFASREALISQIQCDIRTRMAMLPA
ncbi:MAG: riboflavin biosynthesis protein RibF [Oscillospiraceae bacterium]|nr:riboflavin biosynthesis protein RibF [Oscillospiraceae bacterium]